MPTVLTANRKFDARPDRIDYRDRTYNPPLTSLPPQYPAQEVIDQKLADYTQKHKLILDQGQEGSCTGFGLAAVINYLIWKRHLEDQTGDCESPKKVSHAMLYHLARIYDEWQGEDYDGSSCRGAMKGWHRHGACALDLWPYTPNRFNRPDDGWIADAATRPLGAYYRINKDSISDMQAAIHEVGAIYVSAKVHQGWWLDSTQNLTLIPFSEETTGGHAFALVGYTPQGFIVQNSWGPDWGYHGFALLGYADWVQNGSDAWVAVLGAPMQIDTRIRTRSSLNLTEAASGKAQWLDLRKEAAQVQTKQTATAPLSENEAYQHTLVLGNNGEPLNRFLDIEDAQGAVNEVCYALPVKALQRMTAPKLAIYAHGGLNNEAASLKRIRVMAPYFLQNDIYPLFVTWRTGFGESIAGILEDSIEKFFKRSAELPTRGWLDEIKSRLEEARDRSIEVACEHLLVKPIWIQMKQNAAASAEEGAGLAAMAAELRKLKEQIPALEVHLIGHSAGSILHGYLLELLAAHQLKIKTLSLYAPACTLPFAVQKYCPAIEAGVLPKEQVYLDILSAERECADSVGPYGKSLLYLVSRALEDYHKMPLLGMEAAWNSGAEKRKERDLWNKKGLKSIDQWRKFAKGKMHLEVHTNPQVNDGQEMIPLAHGSFDNDIAVVGKTLERIRGKKLKSKVENLHGF